MAALHNVLTRSAPYPFPFQTPPRTSVDGFLSKPRDLVSLNRTIHGEVDDSWSTKVVYDRRIIGEGGDVPMASAFARGTRFARSMDSPGSSSAPTSVYGTPRSSFSPNQSGRSPSSPNSTAVNILLPMPENVILEANRALSKLEREAPLPLHDWEYSAYWARAGQSLIAKLGYPTFDAYENATSQAVDALRAQPVESLSRPQLALLFLDNSIALTPQYERVAKRYFDEFNQLSSGVFGTEPPQQARAAEFANYAKALDTLEQTINAADDVTPEQIEAQIGAADRARAAFPVNEIDLLNDMIEFPPQHLIRVIRTGDEVFMNKFFALVEREKRLDALALRRQRALLENQASAAAATTTTTTRNTRTVTVDDVTTTTTTTTTTANNGGSGGAPAPRSALQPAMTAQQLLALNVNIQDEAEDMLKFLGKMDTVKARIGTKGAPERGTLRALRAGPEAMSRRVAAAGIATQLEEAAQLYEATAARLAQKLGLQGEQNEAVRNAAELIKAFKDSREGSVYGTTFAENARDWDNVYKAVRRYEGVVDANGERRSPDEGVAYLRQVLNNVKSLPNERDANGQLVLADIGTPIVEQQSFLDTTAMEIDDDAEEEEADNDDEMMSTSHSYNTRSARRAASAAAATRK